MNAAKKRSSESIGMNLASMKADLPRSTCSVGLRWTRVGGQRDDGSYVYVIYTEKLDINQAQCPFPKPKAEIFFEFPINDTIAQIQC